MNYLTTGISPNRKGNNHPNIVPYCAVSTKDGHIILAVGNDNQFEKSLRFLGKLEGLEKNHKNYSKKFRNG